MRLPRCRLTVRGMMVVVAVLAVLIGMTPIWNRAAYCRGRVRVFAEWEEECRTILVDGEALLAAPEEARKRVILKGVHATDIERVLKSQLRALAYQVAQARLDILKAQDLRRRWSQEAEAPWRAVPADLPRMRELRCNLGMDRDELDKLSGGDPP